MKDVLAAPAPPLSRPARPATVGLAVGLFAAVAAVVAWRIRATGPQHHGIGAEYLEHAFRLQALAAAEASDGGPIAFLLRNDSGYPALLHLLALSVGRLTGHGADDLGALSLLMVAVLGAGVGLATWGWTGSRDAAWFAGGIAVALPVVSAVATRYYYDLPVVAVCWLLLGVQLVWAPRFPRRVVPVAGVLLAAAALLKWTGLPFGLFALAATARDRRSMGFALASAAVGCALLATFVAATGGGSFASMAAGMLPTTDLQALAEGASPASFDTLSQALTRPLRQLPEAWSARFVLWYPLALAVSVVTPAVCLALGPLAALGVWRRPQIGGAALALLGCTLALLAGWVHVQDERFLLGLAPLIAIAAAAGWDTLGSRAQVAWAGIAVAACLLVTLDFHRTGSDPRGGQRLMTVEYRAVTLQAHGLGLPSSQHGIGWLRADQQPPARRAQREMAWRAILDSGAASVGIQRDRPLFSATGDPHWLDYRSRYGAVVAGERPIEVRDASAAALLLARQGQYDPSQGPERVLLTRVQDPEGGPTVELWRIP